MDHDTYSSGSLIGTVVIDMNTMIMRPDFSNSLGTFFDGWMPIYDTIEGIRGELNIAISMEVKGDKNVLSTHIYSLLAIGRRISWNFYLCRFCNRHQRISRVKHTRFCGSSGRRR